MQAGEGGSWVVHCDDMIAPVHLSSKVPVRTPRLDLVGGSGDESSAALCRKSRILVASWGVCMCSVDCLLLSLSCFSAVYHGAMLSQLRQRACSERLPGRRRRRCLLGKPRPPASPSPLLAQQLRVITHRPHGPIASKHLLLKRVHTGKHLNHLSFSLYPYCAHPACAFTCLPCACIPPTHSSLAPAARVRH